jgi:hypothetical protein
MWKEKLVVKYEVMSGYLPTRTEEYQENIWQDSLLQAKVCTPFQILKPVKLFLSNLV